MLRLPKTGGAACMSSGGSCACCASVPRSNVDNVVTRSCSLWWSTAAEEFGGWGHDACVGVLVSCAGLGCAGPKPGWE